MNSANLLNTSSRVLSTELYVTLHRERTQQVVMFCLVYKVQKTLSIHVTMVRWGGLLLLLLEPLTSLLNIWLDFTEWYLRWLNTSLRAVSGNSRDGECFKLDKQTWRRKSNGTQKTISQIYSLRFCDIWQNFYFYRIFNNENFKMEVEQTNFVTHLIITVPLYY